MAQSTKSKGAPTKGAATSQAPNQPKSSFENPELDPEKETDLDGEATEDQEPESDASDEAFVDSPAQDSAPAGPGSVGSASGQGSSVNPVTGDPAGAGGSVGVTEPEPPKKRSVRDRVRDAETRWEKDFDEIILDIHDHVFGTSPPHEETTAKRKAAAEAPKE